MNCFKYILILAIVFTSSHSLIAQSFEGIIEVKTVNNEIKDQSKVSWFIKEGNHKLDIKGTSDGVSYNTIMLLLKSDENIHILTDIKGEKAKYAVPKGSLNSMQPANGILNKTDETKMIAGYKCTLIKILSSTGAADCWVAKEMDLTVDDLPAILKSKGYAGLLAANKVTGMPLEITATNAEGEVTYSQMVTSVKKTTVSDKEFAISEEYQSGEELLKKSVEVE